MMDTDEVLILSVEDSAECLCLGKRKDKGKHAADPSKKQSKKLCKEARESCLVIVDEGSGSEDDYIEVYGEKKAHTDSAAEGRDVLECVVDGPKVVELRSLQEGSVVHNEPVMVSAGLEVGKGKGDEVRAMRNKPRCPPTSLTSAELTKANPIVPNPVSSTDYHQPVVNDLSGSRPTQPVATAPKDSADTIDQPKLSTNTGAQLHRTPTCWTNCPNCPPSNKGKYHLIDVAYNCPEWSVVSTPLTQAGFVVNRVQRIQNESLWQRLCYEKQLMLRDRSDVNEQLLYHTSKSSIPIICEEGLDLRLSRNGCFGSGIYFSDSPIKCNNYWGGGVSATNRYMFCCRVLLGEVKMYPKGKSEQLRREPPKPTPKPGELKFYDSVMGNLSGQHEYVVYNAYRVMPEYVLHYFLSLPAPAATTVAMPTTPLSHPSLYNLSIQMARGMAITGATGAMGVVVGGRPARRKVKKSRKKQ